MYHSHKIQKKPTATSICIDVYMSRNKAFCADSFIE